MVKIIDSDPDLFRNLMKYKVDVVENFVGPDAFSGLIFDLLKTYLMFMFITFLFRVGVNFFRRRKGLPTLEEEENKKQQGLMQSLFGQKSGARVQMNPETGVTFEDVAGVDEAKEELSEIVDFLKNPDKYT